METVNGEFIMMGCDPSDPSALRSPADAISFIHTIGFLPLFSNTIPGFSIEVRKGRRYFMEMNMPGVYMRTAESYMVGRNGARTAISTQRT